MQHLCCVQIHRARTLAWHIKKKTQQDTYDNLREAAGIRNKYLANKLVLQNPIVEKQSDMDKFVSERLQQLATHSQETAVDEMMAASFKQFKSGREKRSVRCIVLSRQRYNFMSAVYGLVSLELSLLILCHSFPTKNNLRLSAAFKRTVVGESPEAAVLREDAADIGSQLEMHENIDDQIVAALRASFHSLNVKRMKQHADPPNHGLMNFWTVEARFIRVQERRETGRQDHQRQLDEALRAMQR